MLTDCDGFDLTSSADSMKKDLDLAQDRPQWPLSVYGPAKYQPTVFSGLDESPEELRVKANQALKSGAIQEYVRTTNTSLHDIP